MIFFPELFSAEWCLWLFLFRDVFMSLEIAENSSEGNPYRNHDKVRPKNTKQPIKHSNSNSNKHFHT